MIDFPIIDTHVHLWDTRLLNYPWLEELQPINRPFLLSDCDQAMTGYPVERIVFMQCEVEVSQSMREYTWISGVAAQDKRIGAIVPWAPIEDGEGAGSFLETLAKNPLVKGVRRIIQYENDIEFCLRSDFIKGVKILAEYNLSFDICVNYRQMRNTVKLVRQCPQVAFILDHIGKPDIRSRVFDDWVEPLRDLAELPNVCCKVSGIVTEADHEHWSREEIKPYVEQVIQTFGIERVMFGGDWPVVTLAGGYRRWMETLEWSIGELGRGELIKLFHDNARRFYRIS